MNKHDHLRNARCSAKLSQKKLAEAAGIDQAQISRMENGEMWASNSTLGRIADQLDIPVTDLLDIKGLTDDPGKRTPPDSAPAIRKNHRLPRGLRDLASDKLSQVLKIKSHEWTALATLKPPRPVDRDGYVAILAAIRSVTRT